MYNDLINDMAQIKNDLTNEIRKLDQKWEQYFIDVRAQLDLIRWMLGVVITIGVAVGVRIFFFMPK